jgi:hypothetical protein
VQADEAAAIRGDSPEISFPSLKHDFGTVFRGEILKKSFAVKNTGKAPLDIRSIHAACGCINTQVKPLNRLAPGGEGRVSFELDTGWFTGPVERTITVDSNDPENATTILEVSANVKEEIRATPAIITLGESDKNDIKPTSISVEILSKAKGEGLKLSDASLAKIPPEHEKIKTTLNEKAAETKILAVGPSSPNITLKTTPQNNGLHIDVFFKTPLPSGPFRERITIWNTSTHLKELVIPVVGEVVPRTAVTNHYIEFGTISQGKNSRRSISLTSRLPEFKVETLQFDLKKTEALKDVRKDDLISLHLQPTTNTIVAELKTPPNLNFNGPSINISGQIVITTNDPDSKEFKIPFFGVLTEENAQ